MNKIGIKIKVSIMLIITIILATLLFYKDNVKKETQKVELQSLPKTAPAGIFPQHGTGQIAVTGDQLDNGGYTVPTIAGMNIYCISQGSAINTTGCSLEEIDSFVASNPFYTKTCTDKGPAVSPGDSVASAPTIGPSRAYYSCTGNHQIISGEDAYLLSTKSGAAGEWSGELQQAIWHNEIDGITSVNALEPKTAEQYEALGQHQKAEDVRNYEKSKEFYDKLTYNEDGSTDAKLEMSVAGNTIGDQGSIDGNTMVNQENQSYIVGPLNIDYINGGSFGNVTNMTVSVDGKQVDYSYYDDETSYKPGTEEGQSYPESKSDFFVSYSDPGKHSSITVTVTYEWTEYYAEICTMQGTSYIVAWRDKECGTAHKHLTCNEKEYEGPWSCSGCQEEYVVDENGNPVVDENGNPKKELYCPGNHYTRVHHHVGSCYDTGCIQSCTAESYRDGIWQQPIVSITTQAVPRSKTISITIEVDSRIEIGGNVWEDLRAGKEGKVDGKQGENELAVSGIPVSLYKVNANTFKEVGEPSITTTDSNGNYLFEDLDPMYKYYVKFEYNGQRYENSVYNNNLSGGYSNATETTEDRDAFNKKFEEIDGDEGYTLQNQDSYLPTEQFGISAYTGNDGTNSIRLYPMNGKFTVYAKTIKSVKTDEDGYTTEVDNRIVGGATYNEIYDSKNDLLQVDFAIVKRIEFDMAVKKDLYIATVKINGKTEVYGYDKRNIGNNDGEAGNDTWDIEIVGEYARGLDNGDYEFTGQNGNNQLLEVYATYKIAVRNQSQTMLGYVTSLLDYYDETYEYIPDLSWVSSKNYKTDINELNNLQEQMQNGKVQEGDTPKINSNENNTLNIDVNKKQSSGETVYLYLTFKIKNGTDSKVALGEKENHVEIGAFKTYYQPGTIDKPVTVLPHYNGRNNYPILTDDVIAGRIDRDSIPSNYDGKEPVEDDEDKAPSLNVHLTNEYRKIQGTVWEEQRNKEVDGVRIGDGIRKDDELKLSGITVQLVELVPTGKVCIWAETVTDANGSYSFTVVPGDYFVRFIYGEKGSTYNGQDYKSTTYQIGVNQTGKTDIDGKYNAYYNIDMQNESNSSATLENKYGYDITKSQDRNSDAKDVWSTATVKEFLITDGAENEKDYIYNGREDVIDYSDDVINHTAEVLASLYETPKYDVNGTIVEENIDSLREELSQNTKMIAETGVIVMELEENTQSTLESANPSYSVENVDFGLVERPKAQLEIDKSITNLSIVLANGSVLFDVNEGSRVDDFIWKSHKEYKLGDKKVDGKYKEYYGNTNKNRYSYREEVDEIVNINDNGLIQITMDEEIMHGAAIQITYKVKVTNVGEVDRIGKEFYYLGTNPGDIVTTSADQIVDYVANNLQFYDRAENEGWEVISKETLINDGLVNANLTSKLKEVNNVIKTEKLNIPLKPGEDVEKTLILSQLITAESEENDLTYSNMVEIVKISNTVGRRMAYSVVGNQDPTALRASEVDSCLAERVIILPPFGETHIYYILGAVIALILIGGITLIIKKVVKK